MKKLSKYFLRGIFTLLPFGLTVIILVSFLSWTETYSRDVFEALAVDFYFPGLGLIIGVVLICLLGFFTTLPFTDRILQAVEMPFKNVPILKSVYSAIKSLSDYFSPEAENADQQVVVFQMPGTQIEMIGLVTRSHINDLPKEFSKEDRVAVFLPLSYIIGGLTIFVPRSAIRKTDMKVEVAMRSALTAWMPGREYQSHDKS
jgi:uncharacterized membrane protein